VLRPPHQVASDDLANHEEYSETTRKQEDFLDFLIRFLVLLVGRPLPVAMAVVICGSAIE
jgi:hypothetical protein